MPVEWSKSIPKMDFNAISTNLIRILHLQNLRFWLNFIRIWHCVSQCSSPQRNTLEHSTRKSYFVVVFVYEENLKSCRRHTIYTVGNQDSDEKFQWVLAKKEVNLLLFSSSICCPLEVHITFDGETTEGPNKAPFVFIRIGRGRRIEHFIVSDKGLIVRTKP